MDRSVAEEEAVGAVDAAAEAGAAVAAVVGVDHSPSSSTEDDDLFVNHTEDTEFDVFTC